MLRVASRRYSDDDLCATSIDKLLQAKFIHHKVLLSKDARVTQCKLSSNNAMQTGPASLTTSLITS